MTLQKDAEAVLIINDPFVPQLFEELADVSANFGRVDIPELRLQFCGDLAERTLAVATFEHQPSRAL